MDWLKDLLKTYIEDETKVDEFVEKFNKENPKHFMPKAKFNEVSGELESTKTKLEEVNTQITELKKDTKSKELQDKIDEINGEFDTFKADSEKRIAALQKKGAVSSLLYKDFTDDAVPLLIDKVDIESVIVDSNGNVVDWDKQAATLKESYPSMVKSTSSSSPKPAAGGGEPEPEPSKLSDKEFFEKQGVKPLWS